MILHLVTKSPTNSDALQRCLSTVDNQAKILLMQEGVYAGLENSNPAEKILDTQIDCFGLIDDVLARGIENHWTKAFPKITYLNFVRLTEIADKVVTWS